MREGSEEIETNKTLNSKEENIRLYYPEINEFLIE
jgi:hypothetical protein